MKAIARPFHISPSPLFEPESIMLTKLVNILENQKQKDSWCLTVYFLGPMMSLAPIKLINSRSSSRPILLTIAKIAKEVLSLYHQYRGNHLIAPVHYKQLRPPTVLPAPVEPKINMCVLMSAVQLQGHYLFCHYQSNKCHQHFWALKIQAINHCNLDFSSFCRR